MTRIKKESATGRRMGKLFISACKEKGFVDVNYPPPEKFINRPLFVLRLPGKTKY